MNSACKSDPKLYTGVPRPEPRHIMATNKLGVALLGGGHPQGLGPQCSDFQHQRLLPWELRGPIHCPAIQPSAREQEAA